MGHYKALVFTTQGIESKMERFSFDCEEEQVFEESLTIKEAKREYEEFMSNTEKLKEDLKKFVKYKKGGYTVYHEEENHYVIEDGKVGYMSNPNGLYDWYEVGGRWNNELPVRFDKKVEYVNESPIDLVVVEKLGKQFYCTISINDEFNEVTSKKDVLEIFEEAKEWQKESGEEVWVYVVDYHS